MSKESSKDNENGNVPSKDQIEGLNVTEHSSKLMTMYGKQ